MAVFKSLLLIPLSLAASHNKPWRVTWSWGCSTSLPSPCPWWPAGNPEMASCPGTAPHESHVPFPGRQAPCRVHVLRHTPTGAALVPGAYTRDDYQGWTAPSSHLLSVLKTQGPGEENQGAGDGVTGGPGSAQWTCDICVSSTDGAPCCCPRSPSLPTSLSGTSRNTASLIHSMHSLRRGLPLQGGGESQNFFYLLSPPPSPASFSKQAFIRILNKFTWVFLEGKQSCSISSRALNLLISIFNCPICAIYLNSSWQSHGWNMFQVTASIKVTEYFMQLLGKKNKNKNASLCETGFLIHLTFLYYQPFFPLKMSWLEW